MSDKIVRIGYSSNQNITFRGTLETGYTREEWNELSEKQRDEVLNELVWELVSVFELGDDEPDYRGGF